MATEICKTCRTCLCNNVELVSIYNGDEKSIVEMLEYILNIQLEVTNELPQKVCYECYNDISRCYSFKTKCNNSFKILRNLLDKRKNLPEVMQIKVEPEVNISHQFFESENEAQKTPRQDLTIVEMGEITIKSEPIEVTPACQNEMQTQQLYENEIITATPIATTTSSQVENDHYENFQEQNHGLDIHTVQYLIRELKEERDSADQLLEVEVNIRHCASCGAGFVQHTDFNEHMKKCGQRKQMKVIPTSINKNNKHLCPYCDKAFPRPCRLKNHLLKHHEKVLASKLKEAARTPNKHTCSHCDLSFDLESSLKYHLSSHAKEKHLNIFKKKLNLNVQLTNHTNFKKHKCKECYQEFELSSQLITHMLDHKAIHPFVCTLCQKYFIHELELKSHSINVHNDEKPFKCKFCANGFTEKYHLIHHQRSYLCRSK